MRHRFKQIKRSLKLKLVCSACGGTFQQTIHDWQTVSPFNLVNNGTTKTESQIYKELDEALEARKVKILSRPRYCSNCPQRKDGKDNG